MAEVKPSPVERDVLVLIPTFNDHAMLAGLVRGVAALPGSNRVLLVDDGSHQPVDVAALGQGVLHAHLPDNFGLGACTQIAFDHVANAGYRFVVRIDGDGQHAVEDIPLLLAPLRAGQADLVVGCRVNHNTGGAGGLLRALIKRYFAFTARLMTSGRAPSDVNTGFFAATSAAAQVLNRFTFERYPEPQMFVLACRVGLRVREVQIEQREREFGRSSIGALSAARMWYRFTVFVLAELLRGPRT